MRSVLLTTSAVLIVLGITASPAMGDRTPTGVSYLLHENWGGTWSDAEKTRRSSQDDNLCWASAASNVLEWTGWGYIDGMTTTDEMFGYYQDHWTDKGGLMNYAWEWWFTGVNPSSGLKDWSQVDVPGGGFHPSENFSSLYHSSLKNANAMTAVDTYLRAGYGTAIGIYGPGGHAITVWGLTHNADAPSEYSGLYVTDSDDYKNHPNAPDRLRYYEVEYDEGKWYLQSYAGSNDWYIGVVTALEPGPRSSVVGDIDGDEGVDANDVDLLSAAIRTGSPGRAYDINNDGRVDSHDMDKLIHDVLRTEYGDFNLNGIVNGGDYTIWADNYGETDAGWSTGDANGDGVVDSLDYTHWADMTPFVSDAARYAATPEPGTMALLCTGGSFVLFRRKSRK